MALMDRVLRRGQAEAIQIRFVALHSGRMTGIVVLSVYIDKPGWKKTDRLEACPTMKRPPEGGATIEEP